MNHWPSLETMAASVNEGKTNALANVTEALRRVKAANDYNAVIEVVEKRALERAEEIDRRRAKGAVLGRLAGVPFIAKDNYLTFGSETTAASDILRGFKAPYQATVIERLETEGAVLVGKANLDSFAHGASTEYSDFGPTKNPYDPSRVPGGSSGGSAAAVALGLTPFALGSDTGGSIRLPAAFTGVVGYKPTYGLVSRYGVVAMVSSTDVMGPITANVKDAALVLDVMAGRDQRDSTTIQPDNEGYATLSPKLKGARIGVIKEHMAEGVDEEVRQAIHALAGKLQAAGADVQEVSLPRIGLSLACYYIVMPAEVSSNLSRYDGIKYGLAKLDHRTIDEVYELTRAQGFNREVKRRVMIGSYVLSQGYYDAYYRKAQTVRSLLIDDFKRAFSQFDFLVGPTSPTVAFKFGERIQDPVKMYLADVMTVGMSLAGLPAVSIPAGISGRLPIGVQVTAAFGQDKQLLSVAHEIEQGLAT